MFPDCMTVSRLFEVWQRIPAKAYPALVVLVRLRARALKVATAKPVLTLGSRMLGAYAPVGRRNPMIL